MTATEQSAWATYLKRLISDDREFAPAIIVAAQLGIADLLAGGPQPTTELAEHTGTHAASLYRLLRYLASRGVFAEDANGLFSTTTRAEPLRSDTPTSIRPSARWNGSEAYLGTWDSLAYSVRTGQPAFEHVHGRPFFDHLAEDPELAHAFNDVMTANSVDEGPAIVDAYDFSRHRRIVDVGGGHGALLALILDRYPEVNGVLFDAPQVVATVTDLIEQYRTVGRAEKVAGDFFRAVPAGCDAYLLKFILHDWNDAQALVILRNCRAAMPPHGTVLIIEMIIPEGNAASAAKELDMTMLLFTRGRERTENEYDALLGQAGLRLLDITSTASPFSIIQAVPRWRQFTVLDGDRGDPTS